MIMCTMKNTVKNHKSKQANTLVEIDALLYNYNMWKKQLAILLRCTALNFKYLTENKRRILGEL